METAVELAEGALTNSLQACLPIGYGPAVGVDNNSPAECCSKHSTTLGGPQISPTVHFGSDLLNKTFDFKLPH